jgi:hypothetical protein
MKQNKILRKLIFIKDFSKIKQEHKMSAAAVEHFIAQPRVNFLLTHDMLEEQNQGLRMTELREMRSTAEHIHSMAEQEFIQSRLIYESVSALYTSADLSVLVDFLVYDKARFAFREASDAFHRIDAAYDAICYAIEIEVEDPVEV